MTDEEIDILVEELAEDVDCDFCRKMGGMMNVLPASRRVL